MSDDETHAVAPADERLEMLGDRREPTTAVDEDGDVTLGRQLEDGPETRVVERESLGPWVQLDPLCADPERQRTGDFTISTLIILACKPFEWMDRFPSSVTFERELREKLQEKWKGFLKDL
jgi:hypothetical protein